LAQMITGIAKGFLNLKNLTDLLIVRSFPFKILSPFGEIQGHAYLFPLPSFIFWLRLSRTVVNSKISLKKGGEEWQTFSNY